MFQMYFEYGHVCANNGVLHIGWFAWKYLPQVKQVLSVMIKVIPV